MTLEQYRNIKHRIEFALEALACCYDVADYPANGKTKQDAAITKLEEALKVLEEVY